MLTAPEAVGPLCGHPKTCRCLKGSHIFTRPLADITRYRQGIPFLAPEVGLLVTARPGLGRPGTDNDQRDFEAALPVLSAEQRSWLKDAID